MPLCARPILHLFLRNRQIGRELKSLSLSSTSPPPLFMLFPHDPYSQILVVSDPKGPSTFFSYCYCYSVAGWLLVMSLNVQKSNFYISVMEDQKRKSFISS